MMYKLSSGEILFYTDLLCHKYRLDLTNTKELMRLFNEEIEIPLTETELTLVLENPVLYEEMRLIIESTT